MQKHYGYLVITASILGMVPTTLADPGALTPRAALQANYDRIYSAARHKDLSNAARYFSVDFLSEDAVNVPGDKTPPMDLAQLHQMASDYEEASQTIAGHAIIQRLFRSGNQVTVTVVHHVVVVGKLDPDAGKHFHGVFDATTQDTWKLGPQGWLMQRGCGISLRVKRYYS